MQTILTENTSDALPLACGTVDGGAYDDVYINLTLMINN